MRIKKCETFVLKVLRLKLRIRIRIGPRIALRNSNTAQSSRLAYIAL